MNVPVNRPLNSGGMNTCPFHGNIGTTQARSPRPIECTPDSTDNDDSDYSDYERSRSRSRRLRRQLRLRRQRFDLQRRPDELADRLIRRIHSSGDSPFARWPMGPAADPAGADVVADIAEWMTDVMSDLVADTTAARQPPPLIDVSGTVNINLTITMS